VTTSQILACAIAWTAAIVAVTALVRIRRTARDLRRAHDRTFSVDNGGGEVTVTAPMTDAEYEKFAARWLAAHGNNQGAHPVVELRPTGEEQPGA
jgi:HAMP domain-containing protein